MTFLTAMEQAFIKDGATSAAALEAAETKANAPLRAAIHEKLSQLADQVKREKLERRLQKVSDLPSRQTRRLALENVHARIERELTAQNLRVAAEL